MFISPNFRFNGKSNRDMGVYISTFDSNVLNDIGINYNTSVSVENGISYNPSYKETVEEAGEITLQLLLYNRFNGSLIEWNQDEREKIFDWLIGDGEFYPFISDDHSDLVYYFKTVKISKYLSYQNKGVVNVTFKPLSPYCYKEKNITETITAPKDLAIYNPSLLDYKPIIEITNLGDSTTVNKIGTMEITKLDTNQTVIIDNLMLLVQDNQGSNLLEKCNRKWITLNKKSNNVIHVEGNMKLTIRCQFPLIR